VPFGIVRAITKPTYEELLQQKAAQAHNHNADQQDHHQELAQLLHAGHTWEVT
jgi:hypothetical protein